MCNTEVVESVTVRRVMFEITEQAIESTKRFWSQKLGRVLTTKEAKEMILNIYALFDLLRETCDSGEKENTDRKREDEPDLERDHGNEFDAGVSPFSHLKRIDARF